MKVSGLKMLDIWVWYQIPLGP